MSIRIRYLEILLVLAAFVRTLGAAAPRIAQFDPLALKPGKTVEFSIRGQNLQNVRTLWTTFANRCEFLPATDDTSRKGEKLVCRVTVPRDEQVGVGALRIVTRDGISNPVLLMLDDLGTVAEASDNHEAAKAQPIQLPIAIDGQCDAVQEDIFRFHADAGQQLSFEIVSQRLGTKLDPVLRLLKADGNEIDRVDDSEGSGGDSRFAYSFESDGDYLLAVSDVRHLGGSECRYRLRVGSFPLVKVVFPAGGRSSSVMSFELMGYGTNPLAKLNVGLPDTHAMRRLVYFGTPGPNSGGSGWFPVEAGPESESLEQEPNDRISQSTQVEIPVVLNGRLDKLGDRDCFKFKARKGQRLHCEAKTRELGSPFDANLRLLKSDGSTVAEARQDRDTALDCDIPDDGEYVLQVEDLLIGGTAAADHVYRVDMSDAYTGFTLHTQDLQYSAPQGGTFVAKVVAERRAYNGPIDLAVSGLGTEVALAGNKLDGGETLLKIMLPANIPAGEIRNAMIVGKAKIGKKTVTVPVNQRKPLQAVFPNAISLPTQLEDAVPVAVGPPFPPFFELELVNPELYFPQIVGASTFDVNLKRLNGAFKDAVSVAVQGLPAGIAAKVAPVGDGSKLVRVSLTGPANLPGGEFPIRIVGTGTFQEQSHKVVLDNLKLHITKPLVVSVAMAGPIVAGGHQQAEVKLQRFDDNPQPVRLRVSEGPEGLAAPISMLVPKGENLAKIPITAPASVKSGKFDNLIVVATTVVKGQNVAVQSKPAPVEILSIPTK
jgi:hypothetical protein